MTPSKACIQNRVQCVEHNIVDLCDSEGEDTEEEVLSAKSSEEEVYLIRVCFNKENEEQALSTLKNTRTGCIAECVERFQSGEKLFNITNVDSILTLLGENWLNDEILNGYLQGAMNERDRARCKSDKNAIGSYAFSSFFMTRLLPEENDCFLGNHVQIDYSSVKNGEVNVPVGISSRRNYCSCQ